MIESPILQELKAEWTAESERVTIARILRARFGEDAEAIAAEIEAIADPAALKELSVFAAICADPDAFRARLHS